MGTTAEKLTYLNDTKQLLKENINNLGGNLTNEPFRQYASVLEDIYERLPKISGIGASLSLSPSLIGKIKLNEIQGNTLQNGTPTPDSPIPIESVTGEQDVVVCGKNVYNTITFNDSFNQTTYKDFSNILEIKNNYSSISRTIETNTNYFKTTMTNTYDISQTWHFKNLLPNTQYTISCNVDINKSDGTVWLFESAKSTDTTSLTRNFTTNSSGEYSFTPMFYMQGTKTIGDYVELSNIQLEKGSTATDYEPYTGNTYEVNLGTIKLNKIGDYEDSIKKSSGKNILPNNATSQTISNVVFTKNSGGTITMSGTSNAIADLYLVGDASTYVDLGLETGTYNLSGCSNGSFATYMLYAVQNRNGTLSYYQSVNSSGVSINVQKGDTFRIFIRVLSGQATNTTIYPMLNEGSTALPYEPYGKVWYIEKNIGKGVLDGTEEWTAISMVNNYGYYTYLTNILSPSSSSELPKSLCNSFIPKTPNNQWSSPAGDNNYTIINTPNPNTAVRFSVGDNTNKLSDFKTWLNTNNIEIIYVLYTPIYEVITNTDLINQLETLRNAKSKNGTTNINVDGSLPVILGVKALKGE